MDSITIQGYKSIQSATVKINPINIIIGANGAGKSNFINFFEFLHALYHQRLTEYVNLNGGLNRFLHHGDGNGDKIEAALTFNDHLNAYSFRINKGESNFVFSSEKLCKHTIFQVIYRKRRSNFRRCLAQNSSEAIKKASKCIISTIQAKIRRLTI
ncbi:MAG TPA: AAA family ATPase [Saprospiraceae bacterium]|nr:AAA family ATPase [Saprospiraceae bacterium]HMQ81760.1 AAA family ATPase [Saprospiraceae bacterium]